jgi:hypothetical protein
MTPLMDGGLGEEENEDADEEQRDERPVYRCDLDAWGAKRDRHFRRDLAGRFSRWFLSIALLSISGLVAGAWSLSAWKKDMESDQHVAIAKLQVIDGYPQAIREMGRQVDSLRMEMRILPSTIVAELERRGVWRRR